MHCPTRIWPKRRPLLSSLLFLLCQIAGNGGNTGNAHGNVVLNQHLGLPYAAVAWWQQAVTVVTLAGKQHCSCRTWAIHCWPKRTWDVAGIRTTYRGKATIAIDRKTDIGALWQPVLPGKANDAPSAPPAPLIVHRPRRLRGGAALLLHQHTLATLLRAIRLQGL